MSRFEKILSIIGYRSRNNYIQVRGARPRHSVPNQYITSSELVSELTYSMDTRGRRVVTIPSKEVTGKGLPKRQVVSSVVVSNQSSYVYSDKKN